MTFSVRYYVKAFIN